MNTPDNLQQLFDAAKRKQKDLRRQQKLSDLVDQWAAAEAASKKSRNRRTLWLSMGIAAGILLMVSIGLRALQPEPPVNPGTIVAKIDTVPQNTQPEPSITVDKPSPTTPTDSFHKQKTVTKAIASSTAERDTPMLAEKENSVDGVNRADNDSIILDNSIEQAQLADNSVATKPQKTVYERTSNRLVGTKKTSIISQPATADSRPLLALTNSSTSITYELGKINF